MRFAKTSIKFMVMLAAVILMTSCSSSSKVGELPVSPNLSETELPTSFGIEDISNRSILGVYDAVIDPVAKTFTIAPSNRNADYHFPLTQLYPNVLKIVGYGWTPNFWADIKVTHPFPGSGIDGFDPRVIAILPANPGVSFNYPVFSCIGNNSVVLEPDGYSKLFDNLGGAIPGNTNPFKAYFKDQPYRVWSSTGMTSEIQRWQMKLSGFGGPIQFKLVVDVSTNYPNPPVPIIDNAPEPVGIDAVIGSGLTPSGGSADIYAILLDWQGTSGIGIVSIESPDLFNGIVNLNYVAPGPEPDQYVFSGTISNDKLAPEGDYKLLIAASDTNTGIMSYNEFEVFVEEVIIFNPEDVTPPWLNFSSLDVFVDGNYLYVAGDDKGLLIFDITNPVNPVCIKQVDTPGVAYGVFASSGYAYVADGDAGLQIIDIEPLGSAYIVGTVDTSTALGVYATGGYAYVADRYSGLQIIDIDPPESAYIVKTVETPGDSRAVVVSSGYAYVADKDAGLQIIDIEPPASAYIVKTIDTPGSAYDVYVSGVYTYVADGNAGLTIIDSSGVVKTVDTPGSAYGVYVSGSYAYLADYDAGLQIIYIAIPALAYIAKTVDTPGSAYGDVVSNGYAYVADGGSGLQIIDVDPPESASIVNSIIGIHDAYGVYITGGYAYVADYDSGLQIIDVDPPESARIVKSVDTPDYARGVYVTGGYAYVADDYSGLQIIDVEPIGSASIVKSVDTPGYACGIYVTGGYAYIADGYSGLQIIDVEPLGSAIIVKTVDTPDGANGVYVTGGYAYVVDGSSGLQIIDVEPPESAIIVKSVDTPDSALDVYITGGYAYVADRESGLRIIKLW